MAGDGEAGGDPSAAAPTRRESARERPSSIKLVLSVDHLMGALGLFALLPVLAVLLTNQAPDAGPGTAGAGLFGYTAAAGISALLVNRWLPRLSYVTAMTAGTVLSAVGFGLLPYVHDPVVLLLLLVTAGFGFSTHFVLSRVLIAEVVGDDIGRHRIYSTLQIAVNIAAAIGPFVASLLYVTTDARLLLGAVSAAYLLAGASLQLGLPRGLRPPPTASRWPISRAVIATIMRSPPLLRLAIVSTVGTFLYAQFFSAFALMVAHEITASMLRASLLAGPAIVISLFQTSVTALVTRAMRRNVQPITLLIGSTIIFAFAMLLLGLRLPVAEAAILAVLVFSLAEMIFTPMVSTAFASLPVGSRLEAFGLRQICWTFGEALGSLCGGTIFLLLYLRGSGELYWLALAGATLVGMILFIRPRGQRRA